MTCCERLEILQEAARDESLRRLLSPVAAVTFGVIPIEVKAGRLLAARGETWHPGCRPFVERLVGMPVDWLPFKNAAIKQCLFENYLSEGQGVNHATFPSPDFLDDLANLPALAKNKEERIGPVRIEPPPDRLLLLDLTYASVLDNLDAPARRTGLVCGPMDIPFRVRPDGSAALAEDADDAFLVMRKDFFFDARPRSDEDSFHGIESAAIADLPFMIHPTEIQITQVLPDGRLGFHVYDREEFVRPGETRQWTVDYYFLSLGARRRRTLTLRVNGLYLVDRSRVETCARAIDWTDDDLDRWLRLKDAGKL